MLWTIAPMISLRPVNQARPRSRADVVAGASGFFDVLLGRGSAHRVRRPREHARGGAGGETGKARDVADGGAVQALAGARARASSRHVIVAPSPTPAHQRLDLGERRHRGVAGRRHGERAVGDAVLERPPEIQAVSRP